MRPISAATIDRPLTPELSRLALRRRARTKPGGMLKHPIPIRTFADWDDAAPGWMEADRVAHDGGNGRGMFLYTLNLIDVSEQKNFMAVRRFVGDARYETEAELRILQELYGYWRLYLNSFQARVRLVEKVRQGRRLRRRYDSPQTPDQRLMADPRSEPAQKERLRQVFEDLNPAELHRHIRRLQDRLWRQVARRETPPVRDDDSIAAAGNLG